MEPLVPLILFIIFSPFLYLVKRRYDLKEKQLQAGNPNSSAAAGELEAIVEENRLLKGRVENLEAIVCDVDFELNQRFAQLMSQPPLLEAGEASTTGDTGDGVPADGSNASAEEGQTSDSGERAGFERTLTSAAHDRSLRPRLAPLTELPAGHILGKRYRIERLLGRGGMGAVYLAHDEVLSDLVALKVVSAAWSHDAHTMAKRFRQEASAARKVASPSVIRIHDLGEAEGGLLYISMEYFAGKTLSELMAVRGTLDSAEGRDMLIQVCDGLAAAHNAGVIHRDLKPSNILVGERNAVKIIDFGLAKASSMAGLTATGLIMGTPYYMSPEQIRGGDVDARSDIYSLGAVTYHAMTGRPPFDGDTPIAITFAHLNEEPLAPRALRKSLSAGLEEAILAALAKSPRDRLQTAGEFRAALS